MRPSLSYLLSYSVLGVVAASSDDTASTCQALASALPEYVFYPETDTYNASITSYPFIQLRLTPNCIVRPKSAQDVSTTVKILRDTGCTKFAIKGGGHNANVGYNNIEDGVTIDMQSLNAVEVLPNVARVGGGALWQNVYDAVEPHNVSVLGGRIGVVGVPGFLTGGGIAFFSPERGWSCDYVVNFQVVLASGEIVNANSTARPDLFAALKGGQNNFGIVTRFDLKTFPQGPIWGGRTAYAPEAATDLVQGFTEFKSGEYDPYAAGWTTFRYNGSTREVTPITILWYTKPELAPGGLGPLTSVTPKQAGPPMQVAYAGEFARNASRSVKASNSNTIWATTTFRISPTIVGKIYAKWRELVPQLCDIYAYANPASELTFQSLAPPPGFGSHPNSLGFAADSTPHKDLVFLQIIFYFTDSSASEGFNNALKEFIKAFDDLAEEEGVKHNFVYLNFAAWFQDPLSGYGKEQLKKLKRVSKRYDPRGFFQEQLGEGFKIFKRNGWGNWNHH
ncbi:FAD-binding domain-containing protein [Lojkania enalia]|uniref:FAD-binding domain-containing protein n=1 Tax=Lojkania enalia TaxID=147567 RepID=A0A9P4N3W0_9PLEO|nr:FAD-binding domain-containing protein [Didymosphaeria enalia]